MRTIWKFAFFSTKKVDEVLMPKGAVVLCVRTQKIDSPGLDTPREMPYIWAEVDTDAPRVVRRFTVYCTGEGDVPETSDRYIGTIQLGMFVFHVYEKAGHAEEVPA